MRLSGLVLTLTLDSNRPCFGSLSAEDEWLRVRRHIINEKISRGLAQLDRGKGITGDQALKNLQARRAAFLAQNPQQA